MRQRAGYILIFTLLLLSALFFFGVSFLNHYLADKTMSSRQESQIQAQEAARAGLERALFELAQKPDWAPPTLVVDLPENGARFRLSFVNSTPPNSTNNVNGGLPVSGYGGRTVAPGLVHLVSHGAYQNVNFIEEMLVEVKPALFNEVLFANRSIELKGGSLTDSYDSSQAAYSVSTAGRAGGLGTNGSAAGAIYLANADIRGEIRLPPGANQATAIQQVGNAHYDSASLASALRSLPVVAPPTGTNLGPVSSSTTRLTPGIYTTMTVSSGKNLSLAPGTYVFTGDVELRSNASLQMEGKVTLFWLAGVSFQANGQILTSSRPADLMIYGGSTQEVWDFRGISNTQLAFGLYAPNADLDLRGNTEYFGALVANSLHSNGFARFHYDQALGKTGYQNVQVRSRW